MGHRITLPVSDTFNLIDPFDIQNAWITILHAVFYASSGVSYSMYKYYYFCKTHNLFLVKLSSFPSTFLSQLELYWHL